MAKFTGQLLTFAFNSSTHSANYVRSVSISNVMSVVQSTGAGDTAETYLAVLEDGTATAEMIQDSSNAVINTFFQPGQSGTLDIYPNGNTTGKTKITSTAIVTELSPNTVYNELGLLTISFQVSGGVTFSNV